MIAATRLTAALSVRSPAGTYVAFALPQYTLHASACLQ